MISHEMQHGENVPSTKMIEDLTAEIFCFRSILATVHLNVHLAQNVFVETIPLWILKVTQLFFFLLLQQCFEVFKINTVKIYSMRVFTSEGWTASGNTKKICDFPFV